MIKSMPALVLFGLAAGCLLAGGYLFIAALQSTSFSVYREGLEKGATELAAMVRFYAGVFFLIDAVILAVLGIVVRRLAD